MFPSDTACSTLLQLDQQLRGQGFANLSAGHFRSLLPIEALTDWQRFADSWNDLGVDAYMADGGRYRRRRFSCFDLSCERIEQKPHQPHYQSRDYNTLNGGIERWFPPFAAATAGHPLLHAILRLSHTVFDALTPPTTRPASWHVEAHQFRIEANASMHGQPTPEGLHRDGVDWVLVLLITRCNVAEGVTTIHDQQRHLVGQFTLTQPLDAAFVDDSRMYHGVTAIKPLDESQPAYRDVLVVTGRRA